MGDSKETRPSDTMRERVPGSSRKLWLLLNANRWAMAAAVSCGVFLALAAVGQFHPTGRSTLGQADTIETLFQGLLTAIITGVTLVLTLSQLVLSQELGSVGDQRERMAGAVGFRQEVGALIEEPVSPAQPSAFLRSLVLLTQRVVDNLSDATRDIDEDRLNDQVAEFADNLNRHAEAVQGNLAGSQFGEFDVVLSALNYNYSWKLYAARRIRVENEAVLTEEAREAFDELVHALELFGSAREHFKTLYFQWALIDLSRTILYASVPALFTAVVGVLYLEPALFPGTVFGVRTLVVVVSGCVTVSLLPFVFLAAYILRIVTVAKRTLSIGPFILRETDRTNDLDWDEPGPEREASTGVDDKGG